MKKELFLLILLAITLLVFGIVISDNKAKTTRLRRTLETIPLRDDCRKQFVFSPEGYIQQMSFADDSTLVWVSDNEIRISDARGKGSVKVLSGHTDSVQDYAFSPDRNKLVSSSQDGTLRLWEFQTGECLAVSKALNTNDQPAWTMLQNVVYLRNGRILTSDHEGIKQWRGKDLELIASENTDLFYLKSGLISPDGSLVSSPDVFEGGFNVYTRKDEHVLLHVGGMYAVCFCPPDGKRILAADEENNRLAIYDISKRLVRRRQLSLLPILIPRGTALTAIAVDPEGNQVATAHADGTVRIWNAHTGSNREVLHWEGRTVDGLCFSPHGAMVAAYSNATGEISYWGPFQWMI